MNENMRVKKINDDYSYYYYNDFKIIIQNKSGRINATDLCKKAGKEVRHWKENKISKELIKELSKYLDMSEKRIIMTNMQGNKIKGTYVHPLLITHIACWCGPNFAIKVSIWIEEWKKYSKKNELRYWRAIDEIKPSNNSTTEKQIQRKLYKKLGGEMEVDTTFGRIDLLTDDAVIEIKKYDDWKCAVGQVIMYSSDYPDRERIIYLFDVPEDNILDVIKTKCRNENIKVKKINY